MKLSSYINHKFHKNPELIINQMLDGLFPHRHKISIILKMIVLVFAMFLILIFINLSGISLLQFFLNLNDYGNIILSALTFFLVIVTAFYVWITHEMLDQMVENKKSEIKPMLWIKLGKPEFREQIIENDTQRFFTSKVEITNYGRGPAIDVNLDIIIPYDEKIETNIPDYIKKQEHIRVLFPTEFNEVEIATDTPPYNINKFKEDFLQLKIIYEDVERNLYSLMHVYRLSIIGGKEKNYYNFVLKSEELYFRPFADRKYTYEEDIGFQTFGGGEDKLIFKRRQAWK